MTDTETAPVESLLCIETAIILLQLFVSQLDNSGCCVAGKFGGESLVNWLFSSIWQKKIWWMNRSANRLLIVCTNLNDFSLVNHGWFAKFAKLSCYTVWLFISYKFCSPLSSLLLNQRCLKQFVMSLQSQSLLHGCIFILQSLNWSVHHVT